MARSKSVMIVAGEASADLHGTELVQAMHAARPDLSIWGVGGPAMREARFDAVIDSEKISIAGLTEVVFAIPRLLLTIRKLGELAAKRKPAVVVLIDLPDFNLRLAKRLKKLDIPVIYYVSPQIWAWRQKRVRIIKKLVTQMLCILPFEPEFYKKHGVRAQFVGHPLVEELPANLTKEDARTQLGLSQDQSPVIALLPGSRKKEVQRLLPIMLKSARLLRRRFPEMQIIIPVAHTISKQWVEKLSRKANVQARIVSERATEAIASSDAVVVCSGTSTLQTALLGRPMVVVYKVSWLTYQILKRLVKVAHIALVNLIAGRGLVPELIQSEVTPEGIDRQIRTLLEDPAERVRLNREFTSLRSQLGRGGTAKQVASITLNYVPEKRQITRQVPGTLSSVTAIELEESV